MRNIKFFILITIYCFTIGCSLDNFRVEEAHNALDSKRQEQQIIRVTSFGTKPTILDNSKFGFGKKDLNKSIYGKSGDDEFTEVREFESSESIVLPELARYIYPGSLLMGNSIQNLDYKPISATLNPITVSLSIPALNKKTAIIINKPALSSTRAAVQDYLQTADFTQNGQLSYSIEQFSSYDELKVAFGSNVNTRKLFGKNSSSTNIEESMISKRTGFYVKFYQTSFTLDMDVPTPSLVANNNFDTGGVEPVYVSSISYGRMGVLTIETNETASNAKRIINETFNKLFYNKSTNFTQEERSFVDGSDYNLYLIGGDGVTASQAFQGYEAFVNHVSQGTFSKSQPGVPIFCSYSYLKDNSPVKTRFVFDIKKPPVYVKIAAENVTTGLNKSADLKLYFYSSRSQTNTIAHPNINFIINKETTIIRRENTRSGGPPPTVTKSTESIIIQNTGLNTNIIRPNLPFYISNDYWGNRNGVPIVLGGTYSETHEYVLQPSDNNNYIIIGEPRLSIPKTSNPRRGGGFRD